MIWSQFPGFTYHELLNLDLRDEAFWFDEADKKKFREDLLHKRELLYNMRLAFGSGTQGVNQELSKIKWGLMSLKKEEEEEIERIEKEEID